MENRRIRSTRSLLTFALMATTSVLVACSNDGDDPPGGVINPPDDLEEAGTLQAYGTDDPGTSGSSAARAPGTFTGTLNGMADVEVSVDNNTWYTLGGAQSFTLALQASGERVALSPADSVPLGTYRYVRINFAQVEGDVHEGSVVDGEELTADVHFRLGDTKNAVIDLATNAFALEDGVDAQVVLDLNSEVWVTAENLSARQVPKAQFENAATASIVTGGG